MDDFNVSSLYESKNEWCSRLLIILTPHFVDGFKSILTEATSLCVSNGEKNKILMTFQNFISRIPKWNTNIIANETNRIIEKSGCKYLEDLVSCVHVIQLKLLSAARAAQKQKKIDISIPNLNDFIHKSYVNCARQLYKNVYLFESNKDPLSIQKNYRDIEIIVQECILTTVRESIPIEALLDAYMDQTNEQDIVVDTKEEIIQEPLDGTSEDTEIIKEGGANSDEPSVAKSNNNIEEDTIEKPKQLESNILPPSINKKPEFDFPELSNENIGTLSFNDMDFVKDENNNENTISAPKDIERLEEISAVRNAERRQDEMDDDDDEERLVISNDNINLNDEIQSLDAPQMKLNDSNLLEDVQILA
jgi:hypothetical protein